MFMKNLTALILAFCLVFSLISCSKSSGEEITTVKEQTSNEESTAISSTENTQEQTAAEETTNQNINPEGSTITISTGTYRFEITKTNFEDYYSENLLLQFANMLSMSFGVEDYYDWNTSGQNIFTDVRQCTMAVSDFMRAKNIYHETFDAEAYEMFLDDAGLEEVKYADVATFSLEEYNEYLANIFGPGAGQLTVDDFETGKTAKEKGLPVTGAISESEFRCFYTGKDDVILVQVCATGYSCSGEYIYDVRKDGDDYYVYTAGSFETYGKVENLDFFQSQAINHIPYSIYKGTLQTKIYKFGCADDGCVYLKSVDKKYLIAENAEYNYVVNSEQPAEFKSKKAYSEDYHVVDSLPKGTKVIGISNNSAKDYLVLTESGEGIIDSKYLKGIDS